MLPPVTDERKSYSVVHTLIKKICPIAMTFSLNQESETATGEMIKNFNCALFNGLLNSRSKQNTGKPNEQIDIEGCV